ncbi:MAG: DUF1566 domain-containing protein [Tannerella sp.]|jgi:hypothetical protein|nr:DUF1566 domain-containing protein [Tannerella sp.]
MKRITFLLLLLLSAVFFIKCDNRIDPNKSLGSKSEAERKSKVSLNILVPKSNIFTYAGVDASAYENHIDTIYVDLYQGSGTTPINQSKFYGNELKVRENSNDSIVAVGYEVDNITTGTLRAEVFANSKTVRVLSSTDSIPLPKGDVATSFFMSGKIDQIDYDTPSGTYKATIPLQRNVAKVRVNVSRHSVILPSDLEIVYDKIKITTLNIADRTSLFAPGTAGFVNTYINTDLRTGSFLHKSPSFSSTDGGQIDSFYVYENILSNTSDPKTQVKVSITTTSPTSGTKEDTYTYDLYTDGSYNIYRNYVYTLDIKVRGQSLEPVITTSIQPWNDVNIDGAIHGTYLTMNQSEIRFDATGKATINFCSDVQAIYFDFREFRAANPRVTIGGSNFALMGINSADPNLAPKGFKDGQILLDKQHCGSFGFKLNTSGFPGFPNVNFSGKIYVRADNIVKCLSFSGIRTCDAHFIVGDSLFDVPGEKYTSATVSTDDNGAWFQVSNSRLYSSSAMRSNYPASGDPVPAALYLHLDENLTTSPRSGSVTVIVDGSGVEKTIHLVQLPAIKAGRFGHPNNVLTDDSIYGTELYTEQLYEFNAMPRYITTENNLIISGNAIYNGRMTAMANYQNVLYEAIYYCAQKNRITDTGNINDELKWYLPSQAQLMGMWLSYESYKDVATSNFERGGTPADTYWSATANGGYRNAAQYMNFQYGNAGHYQKETKSWVRCVRSGDAASVDSMVSTAYTVFPVIDFGKGMPTGSYNTTPKIDGSGDELSSNNKILYQTLRIAMNDYATGAEWKIDACQGYNEGDGDHWRLPTQRELQAIWILQSEIKSRFQSSFTLLADDYYWSATEVQNRNSNAWTIFGSRTDSGASGNSPNQPKATSSLRVRCVKEMP